MVYRLKMDVKSVFHGSCVRQGWRFCGDPGILQISPLFPCEVPLTFLNLFFRHVYLCSSSNDRCISTWAAQENTCPLQKSQHRAKSSTALNSINCFLMQLSDAICCFSSFFLEGVKCALVDLVSTAPAEI